VYFKTPNIFATILIGLIPCCGQPQAESRTPQTCFEQKDKACLEDIYRDIMQNPTPEKSEAMYLHGQLFLEEEDYEAAKKQFEMGLMMGEDKRSGKALREILTSGNVEIDTFDCLTIGTEECFLEVAERRPEKAGAAYYLLAGHLAKTNPEKAAEYTIKAAELGHKTAGCLLAIGYAHEKASGPESMAGFVPELPKDYEKSRQWGEMCGRGPFPGYTEKHFRKYEGVKNHKAYAILGNQFRIFSQGAATPQHAASVAAELCKIGSKKKAKKNNKKLSDKECVVINVDGEWVDHFVPDPLPKGVTGKEDLIALSAIKSFDKEYDKISVRKVMVQGPLGNWWWKTNKNEDISIEELTKLAIERCQDHWRYKLYGSACKAININGEWVN